MNPNVAAFFFCLAAVAPLAAQAPADRPTMNPDQPAARSDSGSSFGIVTKDRPKGAKTEITAKKEATFDNATNIAEFIGTVVVKDVQFTLYCDKLKVTLNKDRKGLQLVEAFGDDRDRVIIVQETTDKTGKTKKAVGRATKAVYDPATGIVTLTGWPSVQHDINYLQGIEQGTVIKLHRDGQMDTVGGSRTTIIETGEATP